MLLRCRPGVERPQVAPFPGLGVLLPRVESELPRGEFADHSNVSSRESVTVLRQYTCDAAPPLNGRASTISTSLDDRSGGIECAAVLRPGGLSEERGKGLLIDGGRFTDLGMAHVLALTFEQPARVFQGCS